MNKIIPTTLGSKTNIYLLNKYKTRYNTAITSSIINRLSKIFSSMAFDLDWKDTRFKVFHYFCTASFVSVINSTAFYFSHASLSNLRGYVALCLEKKKAHSYSSDIEGLLVSNK